MKSYYICHHCCNYCTYNKTDMKRHQEKKNRCLCNNTLNNFDDACVLTLGKRYIFDKNIQIDNLDKSDLLYIVTNYNDNINIIPKIFKQKKINHIPNTTSNLSNTPINVTNNTDLSNVPNQNPFNFLNNSQYVNISNVNDLFDANINIYVCNICKSTYKYKQDMVHHLVEKKRCMRLKQIEDAIKHNQQVINVIQENDNLNQQSD